METDPRIRLDLHLGEARLGQTLVPVAEAGAGGEVRVGGPSGPVLRPLTFEERARAAERAAASTEPARCLAACTLHAATVTPGVADYEVQEVLALVLAGAGHDELPTFAQTAAVVARATGWDYEALARAEAAEVDAVAAGLGAAVQGGGAGWNRLIMSVGLKEDLYALRDDLANSLLRRTESQSASVSMSAHEARPESRLREEAAPARPPSSHDAKPERRLRIKRLSHDGLGAGDSGAREEATSSRRASSSERASSSLLERASSSSDASGRERDSARANAETTASRTHAPKDDSHSASQGNGGVLRSDRRGGSIQFFVAPDAASADGHLEASRRAGHADDELAARGSIGEGDGTLSKGDGRALTCDDVTPEPVQSLEARPPHQAPARTEMWTQLETQTRHDAGASAAREDRPVTDAEGRTAAYDEDRAASRAEAARPSLSLKSSFESESYDSQADARGDAHTRPPEFPRWNTYEPDARLYDDPSGRPYADARHSRVGTHASQKNTRAQRDARAHATAHSSHDVLGARLVVDAPTEGGEFATAHGADFASASDSSVEFPSFILQRDDVSIETDAPLNGKARVPSTLEESMVASSPHSRAAGREASGTRHAHVAGGANVSAESQSVSPDFHHDAFDFEDYSSDSTDAPSHAAARAAQLDARASVEFDLVSDADFASEELADRLAFLLQAEADLRGIEP